MKKSNKKPNEHSASMKVDPEITTDPLGSWTGVPMDPLDEPIQDADDL